MRIYLKLNADACLLGDVPTFACVTITRTWLTQMSWRQKQLKITEREDPNLRMFVYADNQVCNMVTKTYDDDLEDMFGAQFIKTLRLGEWAIEPSVFAPPAYVTWNNTIELHLSEHYFWWCTAYANSFLETWAQPCDVLDEWQKLLEA